MSIKTAVKNWVRARPTICQRIRAFWWCKRRDAKITIFEVIYRIYAPFEHPLYQYVRHLLRKYPGNNVLDVGGRRSNYTIGLKSDVTITDIPRKLAAQYRLDLGVTDAIRFDVQRRRSNVLRYAYDDMTETKLSAGEFDVVVSVEVLEHVEQDDRFVANVAHVLRERGVFVMTTPNGDFIPKPYPDHKRHYKAADLEALLKKHFRSVRVEYRVRNGMLFRLGLKFKPSIKRPLQTILGMGAYCLGYALEQLGLSGRGPHHKNHLVAVCEK